MMRERSLKILISTATPGGGVADETASPRLDDTGWRELVQLAGFHRMRALLYRRALDHDFAPQSRRADCEEAIRAIAFRNLGQMGALVRLVRAFQAAGIPVLPHKGPLLARSAYGDLALREFADLDILIPAPHLTQALAVLDELGYRRDPELAWLPAAALVRWTGEMSCVSASDEAIDLHWRFTPPHYPIQLDPAVVWRNLSTEAVAGGEVPTLSPEALLLMLAVHGAKHAWEALGWLADLAWLMHAHPDFDWAKAGALARETRCERPLVLAAELLRRTFGIAPPDALARAIRADPAAARLADRVEARWADGPLAAPRSPELLAFARDLSPSLGVTASHLAGLIFHPTERDWRRRALPPALFFLYAPMRLARLVLKYISPRA